MVLVVVRIARSMSPPARDTVRSVMLCPISVALFLRASRCSETSETLISPINSRVLTGISRQHHRLLRVEREGCMGGDDLQRPFRLAQRSRRYD
jgi:hypothetical protein